MRVAVVGAGVSGLGDKPARITLDGIGRGDFKIHYTNPFSPVLQQVDQIYTPDARFKNPFNDVQGIAEIHRVFTLISKQVEVPSFGITCSICEGADALVTWDFGSR